MTGAPRCSREVAVQKLAMYDARARGGYKNQIIAAREGVKRVTGLGVRDLRRWLQENPVCHSCGREVRVLARGVIAKHYSGAPRRLCLGSGTQYRPPLAEVKSYSGSRP